MPSDKPQLVWRAAIKRATMTQKFNEKGEVHSTLQLLCEGDMLDPPRTQELAQLQKETTVTITISATQLAFSWDERGDAHAAIPDQGAGSGRDPVSDTADNLGII